MDKKHPLFIGSCGTYHLYTVEKLPTHRPKGRLDYQLLYIASGRAHFYFDGKPTVVEAGNMVLYRPREEQRYYYYGADQLPHQILLLPAPRYRSPYVFHRSEAR